MTIFKQIDNSDFIERIPDKMDTINYNELGDKPSINGVILKGDLLPEELGLQKSIKSTVLYSNNTAYTTESGSFTLSDHVDNYDYIEVYGRNNDNQQAVLKLLTPLKMWGEIGGVLNISRFNSAANVFFISSCKIKIKANNCSYASNLQFGFDYRNGSHTVDDTNKITIYKIVGYKEEGSNV